MFYSYNYFMSEKNCYIYKKIFELFRKKYRCYIQIYNKFVKLTREIALITFIYKNF